MTGYKKKHEYTNPQAGRTSIVYLMDCMEGMAQFDDKYFDLAVVDPPYGIDMSNYQRTKSDQMGKRHSKKSWDLSVPEMLYFVELFRFSKDQIIWGGNYFDLPPTQCFLFWYKQNPVPNFADGEMAWTSFKKPAMCFDYRYYGNLQGNTSTGTKIHPTQKPIELYDWIFSKFVTEGSKILDTHLGSGSNRIAADKAGNIDFLGFEIDEEYFDASVKRFENYSKQLKLF